MESLVTACAAFLITHLGISSTPLRAISLNALGEKGYLGVYSLLSFITLGAMIYFYAQVPHTDFVWMINSTALGLTKLLMAIAIVLLVLGVSSKNPTAIGQETAIHESLSGVMKITRHPTQWAILIFSIAHLMANGDKASIVLFSTLALMSVLGMLSMDARKKKNADPDWQAFYEHTSLVPFVALVNGKLKLQLADINWIAIGVGLVVFAALFRLHAYVSGGVSLV